MVSEASFRPTTSTSDAAELQHRHVKCLHAGNIPDMGGGNVDHHPLQRLAEVEGGHEVLDRAIEELSFDPVGPTAPIRRQGRGDAEKLRDLGGEEDAREQHTDQHTDGQVVGPDLGGQTDMVALVAAVLRKERRRREAGRADWNIPMRPDHGQDILDDIGRGGQPGYPAIGRLKGLAELRGVEMALNHEARI